MVNVCGLTSGSLLAYRLRGGEGDGGDLHWLDGQSLERGGAETGRSPAGPRDVRRVLPRGRRGLCRQEPVVSY